jgi:dimethylamine/trimethylamine dehydrogenase
MNYTGENLLMVPLLHELGVDVVTGHVISSIEPGRASGSTVSSGRPVEWDFDSIVLVTQRLSHDALYRELKDEPGLLEREGIDRLYRIGDCVAPRLQVADAVFDGHRLAREIDEEKPQTALPYIREFRQLGASDADYDAVIAGRSSVYRPASARPA